MGEQGTRGAGEADAIDTLVSDLLFGFSDVEPEHLTPDTSMQDLDLDSLDAAEILSQLEVALGTEFDPRRVADDWSGMSVGDLVALVRAEVARGAGDAAP